MTAKRYIARDMSNALKKVREELGPDAIILSNKRVEKGVEIVAMLDDSEPSPEKNAKKRFAAAFDDELDRPFESDTEWHEHHHAERIAANTRVAAAKSQPSKTFAESTFKPHTTAVKNAPSVKNTPSAKNAVAVKNMPAGETYDRKGIPPSRDNSQRQDNYGRDAYYAENSRQETTEQSAARLAKEIQQAHERMLSAQAESYRQERSAAEAPLARGPETPSAQAIHHGQNRQLAGFTQQAIERGIDSSDLAETARMHALYDEIAEMRMLLEEQLMHTRNVPSPAVAVGGPRAAQLAGQLRHLGLAEPLLSELLVCANDSERLPNCWRKALAMLTQRLPVNSLDPIAQGGTFAFVGPTGVGKTTTVAKLAARYVLSHGRGKVAIVTTDTYRVGAHDQLKALGRILQIPVRSIEGEHQLQAVLAALKQYPLVLIDTAGFRQGDPKLLEQERLLSSCPQVQRVLVLAANSQVQVLRASLHAYSGLPASEKSPVRGAVLTKLDECISLGEALSALCLAQTPLTYFTAGQEIPDDIQVASASDLVARAVKLARQSEGAYLGQQQA